MAMALPLRTPLTLPCAWQVEVYRCPSYTPQGLALLANTLGNDPAGARIPAGIERLV